jgi:hypothetical protein
MRDLAAWRMRVRELLIFVNHGSSSRVGVIPAASCYFPRPAAQDSAFPAMPRPSPALHFCSLP